MDRVQLRARARELDGRLQALAREYESLWENLQEALDAGQHQLDPDLSVGNRLLGLATGIPHLGRIFGRQAPPARMVFVATSRRGDDPCVQAVFLSQARAHEWAAGRPGPERYQVEAHALEHPDLTAAARRLRAEGREALSEEASRLAIDPADLAEARATVAELEELAAELDDADPPVLGRLLYEGLLYVRPVGRGVVLDETGDELDEAVERVVEQAIGRYVSGDFLRARVLVEVLAEEGAGERPRRKDDP